MIHEGVVMDMLDEYIPPNPAHLRRSAAVVICREALSAQEAAHFLDMLGLLDDPAVAS